MLGLNWGHSEFKTLVLFSTQYHTPRVWFSFLELHPIGIWHFLGTQRVVESRKVRYPWGRTEIGAKLSPDTWGKIQVPALYVALRTKEAQLGIDLLSRLGAGPTLLVCSLTPDTSCSDLVSGPIIDNSSRKGSKTPWYFFWFFWQQSQSLSNTQGPAWSIGIR